MSKYILIFSILFITSCQDSISEKKCIGKNYEKWTNCFDTYTWKNGTKYTGEWKEGKENGYGLKLYFDGRVESGIFQNGKIDTRRE